MTKVNIMSQQENEEELAHVLFLLVSIQCFISLEFTPNICQFFIDSLDFRFFTFT